MFKVDALPQRKNQNQHNWVMLEPDDFIYYVWLGNREIYTKLFVNRMF